VCVSPLSYPACKTHAPCCLSSAACPAVPYFSTSHTRYDFQKRVDVYKICVMIFLQLLSEIFISLRFQGDIIKCIVLHVM
jgi:hypothetical protein